MVEVGADGAGRGASKEESLMERDEISGAAEEAAAGVALSLNFPTTENLLENP